MKPAWVHRAVYAAGSALVAGLLIAPIPNLISARQAANEADLAAATNIVQNLAEGADTDQVEIDGDLLTVRRVAERLAVPVRERNIESTEGSVVADYPEPACLVVSIDGIATVSVGTTDALIPASVQKLLTAVAALEVIGPETTFTTRVEATAAPSADGVVAGDLVVVGGGDPVMAEREYADSYSRQPQVLTDIGVLADAVAEAGVTRIEGDLRVVDDRYDTIRYVESWPERYFDQHNSGPIGALTVNDGFVAWDPQRVEADNPAVYFGEVFRRLLAERGVVIQGAVRYGSDSAAVAEIASVQSPPLAEIVQGMLRESDNNTAEALLKEIGFVSEGTGSTAAGASVVERVVSARVADASQLVVVDGSGLDRGNRVTCAILVTLLDQEGRHSVIGDGLAVAGQSGTLGHRFTDTQVAGRLHAKTGLLNNVNGLAGFVETLDGNTVTFAQLLNGIPLNSRLGIELQEDLAAQLIEIAAGPGLEELVSRARLDP
ncbi:MAG: D-alanyl-D-alanine carboxypeptidase/D-alanyl-D-alanine-endopeptidase [Acidimicrobiales bacterium]|nr:D-alanyl-D-alanine carboxypeptidase/D-alanyl-D-alanine-endopeptidase [Acidimicrobiales bacterium]